LKVTIEHKGNCAESEEGWFFERRDFFSSVAMWYQTGEPKPFGELPSYKARCVPWQKQLFVPQFLKTEVTGKSKVEVSTVGMFGGRPTLAWTNAHAGDTITIPFEVKEVGEYAVRALLFDLTDHESPVFKYDDLVGGAGAFEVLIDGKPACKSSAFPSLEYGEPDISLGSHALAAGKHEMSIKCLSAGPASLGMECIKALKLPQREAPMPKGDNEAHFIRLGIGRAVFAYRLAYGKMPTSLEVLLDSGILLKRYTMDENNFVLGSRLEDGKFVVKSTAPNGWEHSWMGLDARR
jgi:hypothetical protein